MKTGKNIDIIPTTAEIDQILIIDNRDVLRFSRVDENIKLNIAKRALMAMFSEI